MRGGREMSTLITAASEVMLELAIDPLQLEIDADGARILATMRDTALVTRSRGPYSAQNLPPEALRTVKWVALRWEMKPERPEFTVEAGGRWPGLQVVFPVSRVMVRYVVPEAAPPVYQPDPGDATLSGDIRIALRFLADSLRAAGGRFGGEPPVALTLSFPDDPDYERKVAALPEEFRYAVPPVIATIEVDRRRCSARQRAAHDQALRSMAYSGQPVEPLGRGGFLLRFGSARLRDSGD